MNDSAKLDAWISRLKTLPRELTEKAAPEVAEVLRDEITKTIAAGTGPDGKAWQATKEGKVPLRNAAGALYVGAVGTKVIARLVGPEARHHLGRAKGGIERPILPSKDVPAPVVTAINTVLGERFHDVIEGRGT